MGEYAEFRIEELSNPDPLASFRGLDLKNSLKCKHDIIAEWCAECKRMDSPSIKQVLLQENLSIVRNLLSWESKKNHTT